MCKDTVARELTTGARNGSMGSGCGGASQSSGANIERCEGRSRRQAVECHSACLDNSLRGGVHRRTLVHGGEGGLAQVPPQPVVVPAHAAFKRALQRPISHQRVGSGHGGGGGWLVPGHDWHACVRPCVWVSVLVCVDVEFPLWWVGASGGGWRVWASGGGVAGEAVDLGIGALGRG